jgi:fused signal recognition particle receptor
LKAGLHKTNTQLKEGLNVVLHNSPKVDEDFWENLEETLIVADFGASATMRIVEELRHTATRKGLPDAASVLSYLSDTIAGLFTPAPLDIFDQPCACIVFVGINGTGKTTTCGKLAAQLSTQGKKVILGNADTYRAAAAEQLEVWAERAQVPVVAKERGADPAGVVYDTINQAEREGLDYVLIDTAGRLHTSDDLMRELVKVVKVTRKRAAGFTLTRSQPTFVLPAGEVASTSVVTEGLPVYVILVLDATTGQNGLTQARIFAEVVDITGIVLTKLDGSAKGGIVIQVQRELGVPVKFIGLGEGPDDLAPFDPEQFVAGLLDE